MRAHRYDLQYLLYTLALHRYLAARLPGYDYDRHFGGACYLFLRGMRPGAGHTLGVHWARPDLALVQTLDRRSFARPKPRAAETATQDPPTTEPPCPTPDSET